MNGILQILWLIPVLPLLAAGFSALLPRQYRATAATLAIGSLAGSFLLSCAAFAATLGHAQLYRETFNFAWFQMGPTTVRLGWLLDPLSASMLVMVTFVGLLIFIYSVGYMAGDPNFTRFFCFLSLFAAAMLGLVISNSLLLLFICWELVGLASYLLIGFWYHKPSAAAAAKKAFITTRIGDIGLLLGLLWLYSASETLLCYDGGNGCLEPKSLVGLVLRPTLFGLSAATAIGLLIFCGAVGKSGQVPLHVWLPDAMEGPTPVSALIHAATMVAAGVFLVARVYPLMSAQLKTLLVPGGPLSLQVVAWVGAITAVFAASIAVAQTDIKRILAYSTVSQLGYMMLGLAVGGVAVGMFHLITHAFFKALLFLGAGSVIHGCHDEQDIRRMGGLRRFMPVTFATYAIGMMALAGVPVFFSGFWSKDAILHAAHAWPASHGPFYLGLCGVVLTAFYMTRQMMYVFRGDFRGGNGGHVPAHAGHGSYSSTTPHESPRVMTVPLVILATCVVLLSFVGTPAWPWFEHYLNGESVVWQFGKLFEFETVTIALLSTVLVAIGIGAAWSLYPRASVGQRNPIDPLESLRPEVFSVLRNKFYIDELYSLTIVRMNEWWARFTNALDRSIFSGFVQMLALLIVGLSWISRFLDEYVVNGGFDQGCRRVQQSGLWLARLQNGQVQQYLRWIGAALAILFLCLMWGGRS